MPFVLLYLAVEIVALVALASWIGVGWTLLVLLAGTVLGLWLARREGLRAVRAMAEAARDRRVAHVELTDGLLVAVGGLLLVLPGLVTDVAALLLLLPPTRSLVRRRMVRAAERRSPVLRTARIRADGTVVDGTVVGSTVADGWGPPADARRPVRGEIVEGRIVDGQVDGVVVDGTVVDGTVVDGTVVDGEIVDGPDGPGGARRAS
jgi:UPF0716 protein FxsA